MLTAPSNNKILLITIRFFSVSIRYQAKSRRVMGAFDNRRWSRYFCMPFPVQICDPVGQGQKSLREETMELSL